MVVIVVVVVVVCDDDNVLVEQKRKLSIFVHLNFGFAVNKMRLERKLNFHFLTTKL